MVPTSTRRVRVLAALCALGLVAAACGDDNEDTGASSSTEAETAAAESSADAAPETTGAPATDAPGTTAASSDAIETGGWVAPDLSGQTLTFAEFGGADELVDAYMAEFVAQTGVELIKDAPVDIARIQAMVEAGNVQWDVITYDSASITQNCGTLFEEVDTSRFTALGVPEQYIVNNCGAPGVTFATALTYNTNTYADNPPTSYADFFDTETYPGKRFVFGADVMNGALEAALLADGVAPEDLYPLDMDRALAKLDTIKDDLVFAEQSSQFTEAMLNEQYDMMLAFTGRAYLAVKDGAPYATVNDQWVLSFDQYAIVKGAPNMEAAQAFVDYMASPIPQQVIQDATGYAESNVNLTPPDDPVVLAFMPTNPDVAPTAIVADPGFYADNRPALTEQWTAWMAG